MLLLNGLPVPTTLFPDKTSQVWKLPDEILTQTDYAHVTWKFDHEGEFMHLAQLKMLLDEYNFTTTLRLSYLPYGRQDKDISNTATFALWTFAELLNSLNFGEVIITDPHSEIALELIKKSKAVYPLAEIQKVVKETNSELLCYPDAGALYKYTKAYGRVLRLPHIFGEKVRDQLTGNITSYKVVGECANKNVLIIDDICDFGRTFILLTKDLLSAGAKEVNMFVSHGLFSGSIKVLTDAKIKRIFTQNGEVDYGK